MTFADPRELRRRKIAALRHDLAHAATADERARIEAELKDLTRVRLLRWLWPGGPHGDH
jgi:hypothetical protein